jgi:hypothetical protein
MAQAVDERIMNMLIPANQHMAGQAHDLAPPVACCVRSLALEGRSPEPGWRFDRDEIYAPRAERRRGA